MLHLYSYLFHLVLTLFLAGIATVAWISGSGTFDLRVIPWWSGQPLVRWVLAASLLGLFSLALAVTGKFRPLFAVWTLLVVAIMVYGFIFSATYRYQGMDHFKDALGLTAGAVIAFLGGYSQARSRTKKRALT
jgi:hypothetical protein